MTRAQRKRTSLAAVFDEEEARAPEPVAPSPSSAPRASAEAAPAVVAPMRAAPAPERAVKQQTVYLPLAVHEQLRRLAFEENVKMHSLLMEGLDRVFADRGLRSIGDLKSG